MGGTQRQGSFTREKAADVLVQLAERIEAGDRSFDLQVLLSKVQMTLGELRHVEGLQLLTRIGLLLNTVEGQEHRYAYVQRAVDKLDPLDPMTDGVALRALADELRTGL